MADFALPTSADLKEVEQAMLPLLTQDDPIFESFPIVEEDADVLLWEQRERYTGLQNARGLGGEYQAVDMVPLKRFWTPFGEFGEHFPIDEAMLKRMRKPGTFGTPISIADVVGPAQEYALQRRINRIRYNLWTTITTGTITVTDRGSRTIYTETYSVQTFSATVGWSTLATATPLADIRAVQLFGRGYSLDFGKKAKLFMNRATYNYFVQNNNSADLKGIRMNYGATVNSLSDVNKLNDNLDLPEIVIYDEGWLSDHPTPTSTRDRQFNLFIPTGKAVLVGKRRGGTPLGNYVMGRNVDNPNMAPGAFMAVEDMGEHGVHPRRLAVYDGHSGAIKVPYPEGVVVMSV